jgi:hypothetical protein
VAQCLNEALAMSGLNVRVTALVGCWLVAYICWYCVYFDHFAPLSGLFYT